MAMVTTSASRGISVGVPDSVVEKISFRRRIPMRDSSDEASDARTLLFSAASMAAVGMTPSSVSVAMASSFVGVDEVFVTVLVTVEVCITVEVVVKELVTVEVWVTNEVAVTELVTVEV